MSTEPQTTACGRGPDCPKCKGEEAPTGQRAFVSTHDPYRTALNGGGTLDKPLGSLLSQEEQDIEAERNGGEAGRPKCSYCGHEVERSGWCYVCSRQGDPCHTHDSVGMAPPYRVFTEAEGPRPVDKDVERTQTFTLALEEFQAEINKALNGKAEDKGYSAGGDSGGRPMLDAVALIAGEGTHPIGEILYKVARWKAKRNPEDLVKVAAWAFLLWDQQKRNGQ